MAGYTFSEGAGNADILLIKTDADGKMQWTATYGGRGFEYGNSCCSIGDGYIIAGYTSGSSQTGRDVIIQPPGTVETGTVIVKGDLDAQ